METYIALLRGINVGGKNTLPMPGLLHILESLDCREVHSYIQSGNVVFKSSRSEKTLAQELQAAVKKQYNFEPHILILKAAALKAVLAANPFHPQEGKALHFFFLDAQPQNPDLAGLEAVKAKSEDFKLGKLVFYLLAPKGIGRSKLASKVEHHLGVPATARNLNTVEKLMEMTG